MTVAPILAVGILMQFVALLFVLSCVTLVLVVLIQKGRGGGLSGAFGGGMASGLLGSKTGDFLTWFTIVLVAVFLLLAVVTAKYYQPTTSDYGANVAGQGQAGDANAPAQPPVAPIDGSSAPAPVSGGTETAPDGEATPAPAPITDTTPAPVNEPPAR